jgi:hypothetical protein
VKKKKKKRGNDAARGLCARTVRALGVFFMDASLPAEVERGMAQERASGVRPFHVVHEAVQLSVGVEGGAEPRVVASGAAELTLESATNLSSLRVISEGMRLALRGCCAVSAAELDGAAVPFVQANAAEVPVPADHRDARTATAHVRLAAESALRRGDLKVSWPRGTRAPFDRAGAACREVLRVQYAVAAPPGSGIRIARWPVPHAFIDGARDAAPMWVPCVCDAASQHTWDLSISARDSFVVLGPGDLVGRGPAAATVAAAAMPGWTKWSFKLGVPVSPQSVGFVVGPFEAVADPLDARILHACLPGRLEHLRATTGKVAALCIGFMERHLQMPFPFPWYQQVFVHDPPGGALAGCFAGLAVFSDELLHGPDIIDLAERVREKIALAIATQWFGCLVGPKRPRDRWLVTGLAEWAALQFLSRHLGRNYARMRLWRRNEYAMARPWRRAVGCEEDYAHDVDMQTARFSTKAALVVHTMERRLGASAFLSLVQSLIKPAQAGSGVLLSTRGFLKQALKTTGQDLRPIEERWILGTGYPPMACGFWHNWRKKQTDFALRFEGAGSMSAAEESKLTGSVTIRLQEERGEFDQSVSFDGASSVFEFPVRTVLRGPRRRRGQMADDGDPSQADFAAPKREYPVIWVRVDPDFDFPHRITLR